MNVEVSPVLQELDEDLLGPAEAGPVDGGVTSDAAAVGIGSKVQEDLDHLSVVGVGGHEERSLAVLVQRLHGHAWKCKMQCHFVRPSSSSESKQNSLTLNPPQKNSQASNFEP